MATTSNFPRTDADFSNYINIAIPYLNANKARLVTTPLAVANLTTVTLLLTTATLGWNAVYPLTLNNATSTTTLRNGKNTLRTQLIDAMRLIFGDIANSLLTQTDKDTLCLSQPSTTRTAASIPTEQPTITISLRSHLGVTLQIVDQSHPQSMAKPNDASAIEIEGAFLGYGASASANFPQDTDFRHLAITGRSSYQRDYSQDQLRGTEYFRARYLNSRNEPGRWSEVIQVVIS